MPSIRIWADVHSTGVIDELGAEVRQEQTTISDETWVMLQRWVDDYDVIIPLDQARRDARASEIAELDARGIELMRRVRREWPFDEQAEAPNYYEYYSEGLMRTIDVP